MAMVASLCMAHFLLVLLSIQLPAVVSFLTPLSGSFSPSKHICGKSQNFQQKRTTRNAITDPNLLNDFLLSVLNNGPAEATTTATTAATDAEATSSLATFISTMYTATLPPIDSDTPNAISTMKDYFIPTTSNDATVKALEGYVQSKQAVSGTLPNSSDMIQFDKVMPGAKGLSNPSIQQQSQQYVYNEKITKRELEWIAQQFDIYMRKIPVAVTVYALLDFFVLAPSNSRDVLSDELEDDRMGVVMDWASSAAAKLGTLALIVVGIIFIENLTYHPL